MKIKKLHHIGIAVKSIKESLPLYKGLLGFNEIEKIDHLGYNLKLLMLKNEKSRIELMEQIGDSGIIQRYIEKHKEGVHHIAFEVDDLDKAVSELIRKGIRIISEKTCTVSQKLKKRNVFIHPESSHGVMIELCEIK